LRLHQPRDGASLVRKHENQRATPSAA